MISPLPVFNLTETLTATTSVSTVEEIEVYRLNNPFVELRLTHHRPDQRFYVWGRQSILLGFGRRDTMAVGAGLSLRLGS